MEQDERWNKDAHQERRAEDLMPYGAAAKAIFVKANGLPAYQDATGTDKRSADERPAHEEHAPDADTSK